MRDAKSTHLALLFWSNIVRQYHKFRSFPLNDKNHWKHFRNDTLKTIYALRRTPFASFRHLSCISLKCLVKWTVKNTLCSSLPVPIASFFWIVHFATVAKEKKSFSAGERELRLFALGDDNPQSATIRRLCRRNASDSGMRRANTSVDKHEEATTKRLGKRSSSQRYSPARVRRDRLRNARLKVFA